MSDTELKITDILALGRTRLAAVGLTAAKARWLRIERIVTLLFFAYAGVGIVGNLASLIREMVHRSARIDGLQLLSSSIAV